MGHEGGWSGNWGSARLNTSAIDENAAGEGIAPEVHTSIDTRKSIAETVEKRVKCIVMM